MKCQTIIGPKKYILPFGRGEYILHTALLLYADLTKMMNSDGDDKSSCNNDCYKQGDFHTSCHMKIAGFLNKSSAKKPTKEV